MSQVKLKIFSCDSSPRSNILGREYDNLIENWMADRDDIEIIDYDFKSTRTDVNATVLIVKYKLSSKRKLVTEKQE